MATGGQTGGRPLWADVEAQVEVVEVLEALEAIAAVLRAPFWSSSSGWLDASFKRGLISSETKNPHSFPLVH